MQNFGYQGSHISKGAGRIIFQLTSIRVKIYGSETTLRFIHMFWKPNEKTFPIQALCAPGTMKVALQLDATHWVHTLKYTPQNYFGNLAKFARYTRILIPSSSHGGVGVGPPHMSHVIGHFS